MSSLISGEALAGQRLKVSATCICCPGLYLMVTSYLCSSSNILCRRGGVLARFFMAIISSGLWSLSAMKLLPSKYVLNLWQANTMARSSLSMLAYLVSASVKLLLAKAIGWSSPLNSCMRHTPSPLERCIRLYLYWLHSVVVSQRRLVCFGY